MLLDLRFIWDDWQDAAALSLDTWYADFRWNNYVSEALSATVIGPLRSGAYTALVRDRDYAADQRHLVFLNDTRAIAVVSLQRATEWVSDGNS